MLPDPIVLTLIGTMFRGAVVLLLVVLFVPAVAVAWLLSRRTD
jgi:hypothetical protein